MFVLVWMVPAMDCEYEVKKRFLYAQSLDARVDGLREGRRKNCCWTTKK